VRWAMTYVDAELYGYFAESGTMPIPTGQGVMCWLVCVGRERGTRRRWRHDRMRMGLPDWGATTFARFIPRGQNKPNRKLPILSALIFCAYMRMNGKVDDALQSPCEGGRSPTRSRQPFRSTITLLDEALAAPPFERSPVIVDQRG
jgi:hypothetical protein